MAAAAVGYGLRIYANADHLGVYDDPAVIERVEAACAELNESVEAMGPAPATEDSRAVVQWMERQDDAMRALTADVRSLGQSRLEDDHPAIFWLEDWDTLLQLRQTYAADLVAGRSARLEIPRQDGVPFTERMRESGVTCSIPAVLIDVPTRNQRMD